MVTERSLRLSYKALDKDGGYVRLFYIDDRVGYSEPSTEWHQLQHG